MTHNTELAPGNSAFQCHIEVINLNAKSYVLTTVMELLDFCCNFNWEFIQ